MTRRFDYALFDFDGTIADTSIGIFRSLKYAFEQCGYDEPDDKDLVKMIGPPLTEGFENVFGFHGDEVMTMIEKYRERYRAKGLYECEVYDGIEMLFSSLKKNGVTLAAASSKPLPFVEELLKKQGLYDYFSFVSCPSFDNVHMTKTDVVNNALEALKVTDKSKAVMVGDRFYDIVGAKEAGIPVIAVLYGFGNEKEFQEYKAEYIAKDAKQIEKIILGE